MLQITPQMRILVAVEAVDFRKGMDSLAELCRAKLNADPFSGCLFVFRSRGADQARFSIPIGVCRRRVPLAPPTREETAVVSTNRSWGWVRHSR